MGHTRNLERYLSLKYWSQPIIIMKGTDTTGGRTLHNLLITNFIKKESEFQFHFMILLLPTNYDIN